MDDIKESKTDYLDKESTYTKRYYCKWTESDFNTMVRNKCHSPIWGKTMV